MLVLVHVCFYTCVLLCLHTCVLLCMFAFVDVCVYTCPFLCGVFVHVHFCGCVDVGFCACELSVDGATTICMRGVSRQPQHLQARHALVRLVGAGVLGTRGKGCSFYQLLKPIA